MIFTRFLFISVMVLAVSSGAFAGQIKKTAASCELLNCGSDNDECPITLPKSIQLLRHGNQVTTWSADATVTGANPDAVLVTGMAFFEEEEKTKDGGSIFMTQRATRSKLVTLKLFDMPKEGEPIDDTIAIVANTKANASSLAGVWELIKHGTKPMGIDTYIYLCQPTALPAGMW